jgi:Fe-S-cluster containining protein
MTDLSMADSSLADPSNYYPGCKQCGNCCGLTWLCVSADEVARIKAFLIECAKRAAAEGAAGTEGVAVAHDNGPYRCPFQKPDKHCAVYPVRPQTCRLHNCTVTRKQLLAQYPNLRIDDTKPVIDLRATFL